MLSRQPFLLGLVMLMTGAGAPREAARSSHVLLASRNQGVIRIGILIPDHSDPQICQAAVLAIEQAEAKGTRNRFELVVRTTEGPWGAGSKESVALVYEDGVEAIVGSLDGRNAHLAEQVSAKSHLVYLETRATDPTLSQAFVPWFIRCIPGDDQQSEAIMEKAEKDGAARIAILSGPDYDTRHSVRSLARSAASRKGVSPLILEWDQERSGYEGVADKLRQHGASHLVVPFYHPSFPEGLAGLKRQLPDLKLLGNLAFTTGLEQHGEQELRGLEGMVLVCPGHRCAAGGEAFRDLFRKRYASDPGVLCSYMYDAVTLVIEAMERRGADRDSLREILAGIRYEDGVTGVISFDVWGNRKESVAFATLRNGTLGPAQ